MQQVSDSSDVFDRINELIDSGLIDEALALCRDLIQRDRGQARTWLYLGALELLSNNPAEAERVLREAAALDPKNPSCWHNLHSSLRIQGKAVEAEQCARRALSLNGSVSDYWAALGSALCMQAK